VVGSAPGCRRREPPRLCSEPEGYTSRGGASGARRAHRIGAGGGRRTVQFMPNRGCFSSPFRLDWPPRRGIASTGPHVLGARQRGSGGAVRRRAQAAAIPTRPVSGVGKLIGVAGCSRSPRVGVIRSSTPAVFGVRTRRLSRHRALELSRFSFPLRFSDRSGPLLAAQQHDRMGSRSWGVRCGHAPWPPLAPARRALAAGDHHQRRSGPKEAGRRASVSGCSGR